MHIERFWVLVPDRCITAVLKLSNLIVTQTAPFAVHTCLKELFYNCNIFSSEMMYNYVDMHITVDKKEIPGPYLEQECTP